MSNYHNITEQLKDMLEIQMPQGDFDDVWVTISQEAEKTKPRSPKRRAGNGFGTAAAATAAIVIVVGGAYFGFKHVSHSNQTPPTVGANGVGTNKIADNQASANHVGKSSTENNPTGKQTAMQGFSIYRNAMYKFSFQYPQDWKQLTSAMDGGGSTFVFNTKLSNFTNQGAGISNIPKNDAVINAVGVYNAANQTYADIKNKPNDPSIISYQVTKYAGGYEVNEVQKKGTALWFTVEFLDKTYVKTLQVVVPNQTDFKQIASKIVSSYNPLS